MKIGIGNWARPFASVWRVIVFTLVVCATGQAWANLVAEWNGDLADGYTKGKYTMSKDSGDAAGNVSFSNGKAVLVSTKSYATKGVIVSWPDPTTDDKSFTSKKMTVAIQYSGLAILDGNTSLFTALWGSKTSEYLVRSTSNNGNTGIATGVTSSSSGGQYTHSGTAFPAPTKGKLLVCLSGDSSDNPGIKVQFSTYANDAYGAYVDASNSDWNTLKENNGTFYGIKIGGTIAGIGAYYRPSMTVESVQIFDGVVTFPATARVTADSTWSALGWDVTLPNPIPDGTITYVVDVPDSAPDSLSLNMDASVNARSVIFNVAQGKTLKLTGSGLITASDGIYVNGGTVEMTSSLLHGTVKGNGTLYYNGVRPTTSGTDVVLTNSVWRGTVRITYNYDNTARDGARELFPNHWGSNNSKIEMNGVCGYFSGKTSKAGWILKDLTVDANTYPALKKNDGGSSAITTAPSLEGDGEFYDASDPTERFHFNDGSTFRGKITIVNPNDKGMNVQFGATAVDKVAKTIHVLSGASVTVASAWRADGGIVVNGTLTLAGSTSALTGTVTGSGTIIADGSNWYPTSTGLRDSSKWTGTVSVNGGVEGMPMLIASATAPVNERSQLTLASGYSTVAPDFPGRLNVSSAAYAYIYDALGTTTSTSLKIGTFAGTLDFAYATALTTIDMDFGVLRNASGLANIPVGATVNISLTEVKTDNGSITFSAPGADAFNYTVKHIDGVEIYNVVKDDSVENIATLTYIATTGSMCLDDWEFGGDKVSIGSNGTTLSDDGFTESSATFTGNKVFNNDAALYIYSHPYAGGSSSVSYGDAWSAAIRCTTPAYPNAAVITFGSNSGSIGLIAGDNNNQVKLVRVKNTSTQYEEIATMNVVNATTEPHLYVFNKYNAAHPTSGGTVSYVDVYCDGEIITRKIFDTTITIQNGLQIGTVLGGVYSTGLVACRIDVSPLKDQTASVKQSAVENAYIDFLRIYSSNLSQDQRNQMFAEYPYEPSAGIYTREVSGAPYWETAENTWSKDDVVCAKVPAAASKVILTATDDATMTINQLADATYYSLEFTGAGDVALVAAAEGTKKLSAASVLVNTDTTVAYGAVDFSGARVSVADGKKIIFDFSDYPFYTVSGTEATKVPVTGYIAVRNDECFDVMVSNQPSYISDINIEYDSESQSYEVVITPDHTDGIVYYKDGYWSSAATGADAFSVTNSNGVATIILSGDTLVIPAYIGGSRANDCYISDTLPANLTKIRVEKAEYTFQSGVDTSILGGVTIEVPDATTLTFANTKRHNVTLGSVTFNGPGGVTIPSLSSTASISGAITGTAVLTISGTVNVASGGSIANAVAGTGTIAYAAIPAATPSSFTGWTGTVQLPAITSGAIIFNNYGTTGSTVSLTSMSSGAWIHAENTTINPKLYLEGDMTLSSMSKTTYTFTEIDGPGDLSFASSADNQPTAINITKVAKGYSGTISSTLTTPVTIDKRNLSTLPACDAKVLAVGGTGEISLDVRNIKFGVNEESLPAKYKVERRPEGEKGDGFYVYYNGTIFSVW